MSFQLRSSLLRIQLTAIVLLGASGIALSGCSWTATSSTTSIAQQQDRGHYYREGMSEVVSYLELWRAQGPKLAEKRYLATSMQGGALILQSGSVIGYAPQSWVSSNDFTLFVRMRLEFVGSSGAWTRGENGRFVTFTREIGTRRYLMQFNTGP